MFPPPQVNEHRMISTALQSCCFIFIWELSVNILALETADSLHFCDTVFLETGPKVHCPKEALVRTCVVALIGLIRQTCIVQIFPFLKGWLFFILVCFHFGRIKLAL